MQPLSNIDSLLYFTPEILLVIFAVAVIMLDLVVKNRESVPLLRIFPSSDVFVLLLLFLYHPLLFRR